MKKSKPKVTSVIKKGKTFGVTKDLYTLSKSGKKTPLKSKDEYNFVLGAPSTNNRDLQSKTLSSNNAPAASIGIVYRKIFFIGLWKNILRR